MNSKSYIVIVIGILLTKIVGFSREILFANFYGTGAEADIYFQIFGIVTLVFAGVGMALSTKVIINLNKVAKGTEEGKKAYASFFLTRAIFYLLIVTAVLYLCVQPLTRILLPSATGEEYELALRLSYIMIPSFLFVCVAYIISGILQNSNVYFVPSIVSLPYNAIIICSLYIPNVKIEQIGLATTIGWFLHILIQLPDFYRKGYRFIYRGNVVCKREGHRADFSIVWIFISNLMFQMCFLIDRTFVSGDEGKVSALNYASTLFTTISGVFVVAMSSVVFPSISKRYEEGQKEKVCELVGYIISVMAAVFVPFLLVVSLFGKQIIALVYERGEFTHDSTIATASVFVIYCFAVLGYIAQILINKIVYLASKYNYTVGGTIVIIILKLILDKMFVEKYGIVFAAMSTTILLSMYAIMIFGVLKKTIGNYISKTVVVNIVKIFISGAAALCVYALQYMIIPDIVSSKEIIFVLPIIICGIVYVVTAFLLGLHKQLFINVK